MPREKIGLSALCVGYYEYPFYRCPNVNSAFWRSVSKQLAICVATPSAYPAVQLRSEASRLPSQSPYPANRRCEDESSVGGCCAVTQDNPQVAREASLFLQVLLGDLERLLPMRSRESRIATVTLLESVTPYRIPILRLHSGASFSKIRSATGC